MKTIDCKPPLSYLSATALRHNEGRFSYFIEEIRWLLLPAAQKQSSLKANNFTEQMAGLELVVCVCVLVCVRGICAAPVRCSLQSAEHAQNEKELLVERLSDEVNLMLEENSDLSPLETNLILPQEQSGKIRETWCLLHQIDCNYHNMPEVVRKHAQSLRQSLEIAAVPDSGPCLSLCHVDLDPWNSLRWKMGRLSHWVKILNSLNLDCTS